MFDETVGVQLVATSNLLVEGIREEVLEHHHGVLMAFCTPESVVKYKISRQFTHEFIQIQFLQQLRCVLLTFNRTVVYFTEIQVFQNGNLCKFIFHFINLILFILTWVFIQEIIDILPRVIPVVCVDAVGYEVVLEEVKGRMFFWGIFTFRVVFKVIILGYYLNIFDVSFNICIYCVFNFVKYFFI